MFLEYNGYVLDGNDLESIRQLLLSDKSYEESTFFIKRCELSDIHTTTDEEFPNICLINGKCTTMHNESYLFKRMYAYDELCIALNVIDRLTHGTFHTIKSKYGNQIDFENPQNDDVIMRLILNLCF